MDSVLQLFGACCCCCCESGSRFGGLTLVVVLESKSSLVVVVNDCSEKWVALEQCYTLSSWARRHCLTFYLISQLLMASMRCFFPSNGRWCNRITHHSPQITTLSNMPTHAQILYKFCPVPKAEAELVEEILLNRAACWSPRHPQNQPQKSWGTKVTGAWMQWWEWCSSGYNFSLVNLLFSFVPVIRRPSETVIIIIEYFVMAHPVLSLSPNDPHQFESFRCLRYCHIK